MPVVRLRNGQKITAQIVEKTYEGDCWYGYIRRDRKRIPVSQSTTIRHPDGHVEKQWDEVLQREISLPPEEEW